MSIINIQIGQVGLVGVLPSLAYIDTTDTEATVVTAGYLNKEVMNGFQFSLPCMACVSTQASPGAQKDVGWFEVSHVGGNWSLTSTVAPGNVTLPTIANHIATYTNALGGLSEDPQVAISGGSIQAGLSGTAGTLISFPLTALKGSFVFAAVANTGNTVTTLSNVAMGQASVISIPDPANAIARVLIGATATPFVSGNFPQNSGTAGLMVDSGIAVSTLATTSTAVLLSPAADQTITAHNLTLTSGSFSATKILTGATPVPLVDPGSCTITAAAGAANTSTITVQLKDGSGTNIARSIAFRVYSSSTSDGLTLQSAASTGYSVASGGLALNNGAAITTQINAMSSATGGCVLSLLDTGKQTSFLVLVLPSGNKISLQLSAGSYG